MKSPYPHISVIIPALEEEQHLPLLLQDLRAQTLKPHEVLVVDGGSSDQTVAVATSGGAQVIRTHRGVGHQRSTGGHAAQGDILVFLDADVRLAPKALERIITHFTRKNYHVACPWFWPHKSTLGVKTGFAVFGGIFWLLQKIAPSGAGCCIVVTREHFLHCKGFTSSHTYDDISFIRRAARRGRFGIVPVTIHVSDRRFKKEKTWKVFGKYALLSPFFLFGLFGAANIIKYRFAHYSKDSKSDA